MSEPESRDVEVLYAPVLSWLPLLLDGWRPVNGIVEPMLGSHGVWAIMLERKVPAE